MDIFSLKKIEARILEIKKILGSEGRRMKMARGIPMEIFEKQLEKENRPLIAELDELQTERIFQHDNRNLVINILTIIVALIIAFLIPPWTISLEEKHQEEVDIQSLYQTTIANADIFISNANVFKIAKNNNKSVLVPEQYIEFPIGENVHKTLQRELGIDQYRFLLYFLNQTEFLNQKNQQLKVAMIDKGSLLAYSRLAEEYRIIMDLLGESDWESSRLNYIYDSGCISYLLQKTFPFIEVAQREETLRCSDDSLNRLFYHFGYIPGETPEWLKSEIKKALNNRESGLGDRVIK